METGATGSGLAERPVLGRGFRCGFNSLRNSEQLLKLDRVSQIFRKLNS